MSEAMAAAGGGAEQTRDLPETARRPAFLELFFDLVFVVALILLARRLVANLSWLGAAQTLILFLAFAVIWALTAWATDTFDTTQARVQAQVIGVMVGILAMSGALPEVFGERGLLFAVAYLTIHIGSGAYYSLTENDWDKRIRSGRISVWFVISAPLWLVGAFLPAAPRTALWGMAIILEYTAAILRWPLPKFGRSGGREWRLVGERVSERYRQFVIIAFGVTIFVAGLALGRGNYSYARVSAFVTVFAITALMWRIYIYRAGELLVYAFATAGNPSRFGQFAALAHLVMVAGVIAVAATDDLVIGRPFGATPTTWGIVIVGGPTLFLIGRGLLDYTVFSRVSWSRPIGLALLGAMAPTVPLLPPLVVAVLVALILLGVATSNTIAVRLYPPRAAAPHVE